MVFHSCRYLRVITATTTTATLAQRLVSSSRFPQALSQGTSSMKNASMKRSARRSANTETSLRGVKRLRSALAHSDKKGDFDENLSPGNGRQDIEAKMPSEKMDATSSLSKPEVTLGRRFSDVASTIPIKKRRIQILEAVRSPSPPPRSPLGEDDENYLPLNGNQLGSRFGNGGNIDDRSHWDLNMEMEAWERPRDEGPSTANDDDEKDVKAEQCKTVVKVEDELDQEPYHAPKIDNFQTEHVPPSSLQGEDEDELEPGEMTLEERESMIKPGEDSSPFPVHANYSDMDDQPSYDLPRADAFDPVDNEGLSSISKVSDDLRRAQTVDPVDKDELSSIPKVSETLEDFAIRSTDEIYSEPCILQTENIKVEGACEESSQTCLNLTTEVESGHEQEAGLGSKEVRSTNLLREDEVDLVSGKVTEGILGDENADSREHRECQNDEQPVEEYCQISSDWGEQAGAELEAENVDYGESDEDNGNVFEVEPGELTSAGLQDEIDYEEDEQGEIHDTDHSSWDQHNMEETDKARRQWNHRKMENGEQIDEEIEDSRLDFRMDSQHNYHEEDSKRNRYIQDGYDKEKEDHKEECSRSNQDIRRSSNTSTRIKASGWDQLPEGFDKAEDALRAVKDNTLRGGRGTWVGPSRGTSSSTRQLPGASFGDRPRHEDNNRHRHDLQGQRMDDMHESGPRGGYIRDFGRGRIRGRGPPLVARGRGRHDPWLNGSGAQGQWGPKHGRFSDGAGFGPRGQANAAAVAAAKVESSGFVVAPDGTITKPGSPARGPSSRPFPGSSRNGGAMMFNMGRGLGPSERINVGSRVGIGPGRGINVGPEMRLNLGMNIGVGMNMNPGMRAGMMERHRMSPYGRGSGPMVRSPGRDQEKWDRRESSPAFRSKSLHGSRSQRRSRSRSRSLSPRIRSPQSRSPGHIKFNSREPRESSPPGCSSVGPPPKLPLPPPPPRSQRSPPAGLKRLGERRDGDRRYSDQLGPSISPRRSSHTDINAPRDLLDRQPLQRQGTLADRHQTNSASVRMSQQELSSAELRRGSGDELVEARKDDVRGRAGRMKDIPNRIDELDRERRMDMYERRSMGRDDGHREIIRSRRGSRHSNREADDDIAPRRRRPPP